MRTRRIAIRLTALFACLSLTLSLGGITRAHEAHGKPARLQIGTCDALGAAAFTLIGVGAEEDADGLPVEPPVVVGSDSANALTTSTSTVAATVDQIVSGGHAIVVYASDEAMDVPIACGAVGGIQLGEDLIVGLEAIGDEGQSGVAFLRDGASGAESTVTIVLTAPGDHHAEDAAATPPAGTPAP